jgi:hypothetical protein
VYYWSAKSCCTARAKAESFVTLIQIVQDNFIASCPATLPTIANRQPSVPDSKRASAEMQILNGICVPDARAHLAPQRGDWLACLRLKRQARLCSDQDFCDRLQPLVRHGANRLQNLAVAMALASFALAIGALLHATEYSG